MTTLLLALVLSSSPALAEPVAPPAHVVVHIDGMVCSGCQQTISTALDNLSFVKETTASFAVGGACLDLSGEGDTGPIREAVTGLGYTVTSIESVASCPRALRKGHRVDPWDGSEGFDVQIISRGEEVDLREHLAADKYTVVDFGAPWCGPCHVVAAKLKEYLTAHEDVAVRAVTLDARNPKESYAMPAAKQHLKFVAGIPYFLVYDASGKTIYKGGEVEDVMKNIDKQRSRK